MARIPINKVSVANGEIHPKALARIDTEAFQNSALTLRNLVCQKEGSMTERQSFNYAKATGQDTYLIPFKASKASSFVIELDEDGLFIGVDKEGLVNRELVGLEDDISGDFSWVDNGSGDTRLEGNNDAPPNQLDTDSIISGYDSSGALLWQTSVLSGGFFGKQNIDIDIDYADFTSNDWDADTVTLKIETRGSLNINTSFGYPSDTGLEPIDFERIQYVQDNKDLYLFERNMKPKKITLLSDGISVGVSDITFVTDSITNAINGPSASSPPMPFTHYPSCATAAQQRLIVGRQGRVFFSRVGDYLNFETDDGAGTVSDSDAFVRKPASREANDILWIEAAEKFILVGTEATTYVGTPSQEYGSFSPFSLEFNPIGLLGSESVMPRQADKRIYLCERGGRNLHYVNWDNRVRGYLPKDITEFKEHITESGVKKLAYLSGPEVNQIIALKNDGTLIAQVLNTSGGYEGFYRIVTKDTHTFDDISVIYDKDTGFDQLFVIATRDGGARTIDYLDQELLYKNRDEFFTNAESQNDDDYYFKVYNEKQNFKDVRLDSKVSYNNPIPHNIFFEERSGDYYFYVKVSNYFTDLNAESSIIGKKFMVYGLPLSYEILGVSEGMGNSYIRVDVSNGIPERTEFGPNGVFAIESVAVPHPSLVIPQYIDMVVDGIFTPNVEATSTGSGLEIVLDEPAKDVSIGYNFFTYGKFPVGFANSEINSLFNKINIAELAVHVTRSGSFLYGTSPYALNRHINPRQSMHGAAPYFTGDTFNTYDGDTFETEKAWYVMSDSAHPLNIRNQCAYVEVQRR